MIRLTELLLVSSAHEFRIKDSEIGKIIWKGTKSDESYEDMLDRHHDALVVGVKARSDGWGRGNSKTIMTIEISRPILG